MNKTQFEKKFLNQRYYGFVREGSGSSAWISDDLEDIVLISLNGWGRTIKKKVTVKDVNQFIEDVQEWCYDSRSKTFSADIDGPTFSSASTKKELMQRLKKAGCFVG